MKTGTKWTLALCFVALVAVVGAAFFYFFLPYHFAESEMPANAILTLEEQADGSYDLSWPVADRADFYSVEVLQPGSEQVLFSQFVENGIHCSLPGLRAGETVLLRVNTAIRYDDDDPEKIRFGEDPAQVQVTLTPPQIEDLQWSVDDAADTVTLSYSKSPNDDCRIYLKNEDGSYRLLKTVGTNQAVLTFSENGDLPLPAFGQEITIALDACRITDKLEFGGCPSQEFTLTRDDFLGRDLGLELADLGSNVAQLTWSETKGEAYQIQLKETNRGDWTVLGELPAYEERSFTTHHLSPMGDYLLRVVALGGQTMEDSEYAAVSEEISFQTTASTKYATIWPVTDLKTYSDPELTQAVGSVKTAAAYCVLDEVGGAFAIGVDGKTVYIDSNYCLINLPEYIGDLCSYSITNSHSSIFMVHEYAIPQVTGEVTGGYERVRLENGEYLVPLLYPTAKKLMNAAKAAQEQGYRLKIYDAFRPNRATVEIYNRTEAILDNEIPKKTYKGGVMTDLPQLPAKENEDDPDPVMTYRLVMTHNSWSLGSFLAKGASLHNLGIAVDLTLETLDGQEVSMQTSMHDLSCYSVLSRNNANANTLAAIMKGAGMGELVSEWWHFQDNEIRKQLQLPVVWAGVSPECWMKDDFGWRYRRADGTYFAGGDYDIYGTVYRFDENGYIINN